MIQKNIYEKYLKQRYFIGKSYLVDQPNPSQDLKNLKQPHMIHCNISKSKECSLAAIYTAPPVLIIRRKIQPRSVMHQHVESKHELMGYKEK